MKIASCPIHGSNPRPTRCDDCARIPAAPRASVPVASSDKGAVVRVTNEAGQVSFRPTGTLQAPVNDDPWKHAR